MRDDYILIMLIMFYFFGSGPQREYEIAKARTVRCSKADKIGHAMGSGECFDYARAHKEENYLVEIREREFHVSFSNQTVAEIGAFHEAESYSCRVFDANNWICPIGQYAKEFDPNNATLSSRIVMKDGEFEEWINGAIYPVKDIHLNERTTHYVGNWMEFKIIQFCLFFGIECKKSYNIDAEDDYWL